MADVAPATPVADLAGARHPNLPQHLYPVNLVLTGQRCLVVGGGEVAARKVSGLLEAGARVVVVAPEAVAAIATEPRLRWQQRPYQRGEVASYRLGIAATGVTPVDDQVYADAEAAGVLVNSADDPARCRFILPAVVRRGDVQLTVSTNGRSPALATWLRRRLVDLVDDDLLALLDLLAATRADVRSAFGTSEVDGWQEALDGGLLDLVGDGRVEEARRRLRSRVGLDGVGRDRVLGTADGLDGEDAA
jgi:precorrin-2 dehydrogenase/sirohydrochlorin ferrochelatase